MRGNWGPCTRKADTVDVEIPAGRRHIIERPRLTRLLDETSARVIMLVAPAGYGKTTLARQWLANRPHAWYQASAASADVAALALGLVQAAAAVVPDVGSRLREWLPTTHEPEREVRIIAELLSEDMSAWPDDAWLGIDDYHLLSSDAAHDLVDRLHAERAIKLLVSSRHRPKWATARALLYGDFYELGSSSLAMSTGEASLVLGTTETKTGQGLVALADGWPAVIGLAALSRAPLLLDGQDLPAALHDYFAEELYATLQPETRDAVCYLALSPTITRTSASDILGDTAAHVLEEATHVGFFVPRDPGALELHPLLRAFLLRKLDELAPKDLAQAVTRTSAALIRSESWDDAYSLLSRFVRFDLLDDLLAASLVSLTSQGRLPTLRRWVDQGRAEGLESPLLDLAEAELCFRQGLWARAETLARDAARILGHASALTSSALYRAGQCRYFMDEGADALEYFRDAQQAAQNDADARNALWGQFIAAIEMEDPDAPRLLQEYEAVGSQTRDSAVRVANGALMLAIRTGGIDEALVEAGAATTLAKEATDPIVRSSFWHIYGAALMLSADYAAALEAVNQAVEEIDRFHIDFARPHIYINRAAAYIGLRQFWRADTVLNEVEWFARERGDVYLGMNAMTLRCRLLLSEGSPREALAATCYEGSGVSSLSQQAEFAATRAAAFACAGHVEKAAELVARAEELSSQLEPRLISQWTRVLIALLLDQGSAKELIWQAFHETARSGALDSFVFAYRLDPRILDVLSEDSDLHERLIQVLLRADDAAQAERIGLSGALRKSRSRANQLTPRERDVYALLAEGRTNREIAHALFISEVTVKVHLRHIFRKLGVKTRTEAAILSSKMPRP